MKILLINPPYRNGRHTLPMGLAYIGAVLLREGHQVSSIDVDAFNHSQREYVQILKDRDFDLVGIGGMTTTYNFVKWTCNRLKEIKPHAWIVAGGGIVTSSPEVFMKNMRADFGVLDEGEETIVDLVNALETGRDPKTVPGLVLREGDKVVHTAHRPSIANLDALPYPAWDLFYAEKVYSRFASYKTLLKAGRRLSVEWTRGCPYQCTFCYTEKKVRQRSIDYVLNEMEELKHRYGIGAVHFCDNLFVVRRDKTLEFCEKLIERNLDLTWQATGRCNLTDKEFLTTMRRAGCTFLGLGIESGSSAVLKRMHKNQTPEQIVHAVKTCTEVGITPGGTFILGMPGESRQTIRETVELYKQINEFRSHVNPFFYATPYPGTSLYDEMKAKGRIGDEDKYFEKLSTLGDAVDFVINCTDDLADEELISIKAQIEKEVFEDFKKKHPYQTFLHALQKATGYLSLRKFLVFLKLNGAKETAVKIVSVVRNRLFPDPGKYPRHWTKPSHLNPTHDTQPQATF